MMVASEIQIFNRWGLVVALVLALHGAANAADQAPPTDAARSQVENGPVQLTVEAPRAARLADNPTLTVTVTYEPGVKIEKPLFADALGEFLIRDVREPLLETRDGREVARWILTLEPTQAGKLEMPPISVVFEDQAKKAQVIESAPLAIEIGTVVTTNPPSLKEIKPLSGPLPPESLRNYWLWAAVAAAALLAAWFLRRRKQTAVEREAYEFLTPRERAERELAQLLADGLARRDVKLFYVALTGIIRRYIERTTGVHAPEQTTEEFLHEIGGAHLFAPEEQMRLKDFLESADLVKFAARFPRQEDIDDSIAKARDFISGGQLLQVQEVAA